MNISILDDYLDTIRRLPAFARLTRHSVTVHNDHTGDEAELVQRLASTEALVTIRERTTISASLLRQLPRLRLISCRSDVPHIDLAACTALGILVCSDQHPDQPNYATAELVWGLIIAARRRIPQQMARLKAGQWQGEVGTGLRGETLGIFGYGKIGRLLADFARVFGMQVLVWGRAPSRALALQHGLRVAASQQQLFEESDVLTLQLRLREETRGIVTATDLALMKPSALIVNTSRAGLIASGALVEALRKGRPGAAALDVYEQEPLLDTADPLLQMDNVTCTPHIGYVELHSFDNSFASIFDQINAFDEGRPVNMLNPGALERMRST